MKTYKWARRMALATYRKALKAAEKGDWDKARILTYPLDCAFCHAETQRQGDNMMMRGGSRTLCPTCPALRICKREPYRIGYCVQWGDLAPTAGLRRLRSTIGQLEKLEIGA